MNFPVFPLNGAILFPNTNLPLNIFEDRYIDMVDYALSHSRLIGMIQTKKNKDLFTIGCLGKITNFTETSDGLYDRHDYKIIGKNGESIVVDNWQTVQEVWWNRGAFLSRIEN